MERFHGTVKKIFLWIIFIIVIKQMGFNDYEGFIVFGYALWDLHNYFLRNNLLSSTLRVQILQESITYFQQMVSIKRCVSNFDHITSWGSEFQPVWPDVAIFRTLGNFLKPLTTINLAKSPTFLGNFCKGFKIYHFSNEIIFGQFL